jgi:polar amino acid transport system permease protein
VLPSSSNPVPTTQWQPSALQRGRETYRRNRTIRSIVIAVVITAVVVTVVALVIVNSTGWPRTRDTFLDLRAGWAGVPELLRALWINVQIMLISEAFILVIGATVAVLRTLQGPAFFPVRFLMAAYVDVFRGLPLLIVLLAVGYGIPALRLAGAPTSEFVLGIISLVLCYSAYVAEVFRAGIESVHYSQRAAARSLGLTTWQTTRHVVLPQAVRRVLPPLLNDFVSLQKDTSLVYTLGVIEVTLTAQNQVSKDFKFVHYIFAGLIFLALTVPATRFTDWYSRRKGWIGGGVIR